MTQKNKNTSPATKMENEKLNTHFTTFEVDKKDKVLEILNILEERNLISNANFDRLDTESEHNPDHLTFYFDNVSKSNLNSLDAIIKNFVEFDKLKKAEINKLVKDYKESLIIDFKGANKDNDTMKFNLDSGELERLKDLKSDVIYHGTKTIKIEDGYSGFSSSKYFDSLVNNEDKRNLKNSVGNVQMNGSYKYNLLFSKSLDSINDLEKTIEKSFYDAMKDYNNNYNFDLTKLKVNIDKDKDNMFSVEFNNLFSIEGSSQIDMYANNKMGVLIERFVKTLHKNSEISGNIVKGESLIVNDEDFKVAIKKVENNRNKLSIKNERENSKVEDKELEEEIKKEVEVKQPEVKQVEVKQVEVKQVKEVDTSKYKDMDLKEVEELKEQKESLKIKMLEHIEMSKVFGTYEDIKDKLDAGLTNIENEVNTIIEVIEQKEEEERINNLVEINENLTTELKDLSVKFVELETKTEYQIENLNTELTKVVNDNNIKDGKIEELSNSLNIKDKEIEGLNNTIEDLEDGHTKEVLELKDEIETITNQKEYEIKELKEEYTILINNLEQSHFSDISNLEQENEELKEKLTYLEQENKEELRLLEQENEQLKNKILTLSVNSKNLNDNLESKDTTIKNLKIKNKDLNLDVEDLNNQIINVKDYNNKEIENLDSELAKKDTKLEELKQELKTEREKISTLEKEILELEAQKQLTPEVKEVIKEVEEVKELKEVKEVEVKKELTPGELALISLNSKSKPQDSETSVLNDKLDALVKQSSNISKPQQQQEQQQEQDKDKDQQQKKDKGIDL